MDLVKILVDDESSELISLSRRPEFIVNFARSKDNAKLLDLAFNLALDPSWHKGFMTPYYIHKLRLIALNRTCDLGTFTQLLKDAKPHITDYQKKWLRMRAFEAMEEDHTDILKYLIENEGFDVNRPKGSSEGDECLFESRWPTKLVKHSWIWSRYHRLLSQAARKGLLGTFKIILDAGAEHDHAIEFAAMCGSRTIVRLLWNHGDNKSDAVQGAFAMAVDREDTAMFHLLEELGAKLDDDVRVAVIEKAQEEGLESMVGLLTK